MNPLHLPVPTLLVGIILVSFAPESPGQAHPVRPVRIIVPFPPGGGVDTVTRLLAHKMGENLGASFVIDNRAGSAGMIGADLAARAAPDGYTLLTSAPESSS